ncbi:serine/threonine-protein kinase STN8, chloroplastic [Selaginella moellendorffii]|nr:serine/threonine-protein kinase STN8, chloroplastic [Selaginella moellendorffii]|eukprot:XP_024525241.1 serine/threonine-protein kinase STN8, chloroplastic [Selaginella moellendorffii]
MTSYAAALGSPWLGRPIQLRKLRGGSRGRISSASAGFRVSVASLERSMMESSVGNALRESGLFFHKTILQDSLEVLPSSQTSLEWWAVAAPAMLWFLLASPGGISGVVDFLASPLHARRQREFPANEVEVGRRIGEGSFGIVYDGYIGRGTNGDEGMHVILKKAKAQVSGSSEMHNTEVYMNRYLQRNAPEAVADFLGTVRVKQDQVKRKLTEGLWLVWKFQGYHTLNHYMKQKTFPENLSKQLLGDSATNKRYGSTNQRQNALILRTIMTHLLYNLQQIHGTGVVHRDVKPLNLILAGDTDTFKLVDLGACVNLRSGYNYVPNETIMDPDYAPPEQYVMPTRTPRLPPDPLCSLISPLIWLLNTPDRFDVFSAGLVMMQLSVKSLRHESAMKHFSGELKRAGYDLNKWRKKCQVPKEEFSLLDADDGAGWELVTALLQPRHDKAFMIWPSLVRGRPSAAAALKHRFFRGTRRVEPIKIEFPKFPPNFEPAAVPMAALSLMAESGAGIKVLQEKVVGEMATKLKSPEFTYAITAAIPIAALICLGLSSGWMLMQGLQTSAQLSYGVSQNLGITGPASAAFCLFVLKQLLVGSAAKTNKNDQRSTSTGLASVSGYGEVRRLAEEVGALDTRLGSLEALVTIDSGESLEDKHYQQIARMQSLLAQPQR